ncbi:cytochrome P450 78A7-like [Salvia divinorum]|uniref:Cytochrome P450 78A7-like n=1 Tax=Salvia divinorum TaxID=28513 RepID=A0ABD1GBZ5_SALDI
MGLANTCDDTNIMIFSLPTILEIKKNCDINLILFYVFVTFLICGLINRAFSSGGPAWKNGRNKMGQIPIPGPNGLPIFGSLFSLSRGLAHRKLARMASSHAARRLMAFSLGSTPAVITTDPCIAHEILTSPHFASRPIKESAKQLMFSRAIGFAPDGPHWRMLRSVASTHLFAPKRILAHEGARQLECSVMLSAVASEQSLKGHVQLRKHLQAMSLNMITEIMFGKRYDVAKLDDKALELNELVREGFELLGAFNWSDHLPWLKYFYDPFRVRERCAALVPRVERLVKKIIKEHRDRDDSTEKTRDEYDFVYVLLTLYGEEKLDEDGMVAVLWEMIFRGTDTTALLIEWIMTELILNPKIQANLHKELQTLVPNTSSTEVIVADTDVTRSPYLEAVVKEALRRHPPAHDPMIWGNDPFEFRPERFLASVGGAGIDVRGGDLRLAPFGAGRRVCPGRKLGLASVSMCVAELVMKFEWIEDERKPVDLSEELKLSCEMKKPLSAIVIPRVN